MHGITKEILSHIKRIASNPTLFAASPEEASATVQALAAVALAESSNVSFFDALWDVERALVPLAMPDVCGGRTVLLNLCDDFSNPRRTSFEAVGRHTEALLKALANCRGVGLVDDEPAQ